MKVILLTISVVSLLSACTTGEQMSRLEPGMTRQQVVGILGRPNAVRNSGPYEQLEYTHRLITGWSWDRSDFKVILEDGRVVEFGHGEVRDRTPQVVYMQSNAPSQPQPVVIHTSHRRNRGQLMSTYNLHLLGRSAIRTEIKTGHGSLSRALADKGERLRKSADFVLTSVLTRALFLVVF
jgi:SmpA/OmlA family protein